VKPRVVYWNNIPAPYMVQRFNALARRDNLELEIWFSARTKKGRSWKVDETSWNFRYVYLPAVNRGAYPLALPAPLLRGSVPDVFVSLYAAPVFLLGSALASARGARTVFWVEVTFDSWVKRRAWKEALKSAAFRRVDAIFTAGRDGSNFALRYGASAERIFVVPHVVDFEHYARRSASARRERGRIRAELGLRGVTFIYVGRLWSGKGLTYLLDAFERLQRTMATDVSLLLVGDGVDEELLRARSAEKGLANVIFADFHHADSLPSLYAAADVFVFPTLGDPFGMVVPEAMACSLPVIATTASGEISDRVVDGLNGFIVPPADSEALSERMRLLAQDPERRRAMAEESRLRVEGQSLDHWAEAFESAICRTLDLPKRRQGD
jgi:glycosyltransferase involved in cell wall biosynthesis